jgi:putative Mg2+ transporter-C (MgtC) family protein
VHPDLLQFGEAFRLDLLAKLLVAILLGGLIGAEREKAGKPAGLRTNLLICVGAALITDVGMSMAIGPDGQRIGDPARLAAQVISGIGFLGAGSIMQAGGFIQGLTSAATIWVVAALGIAAGAGRFVEALGAGVVVLITLAGLDRVEHRLLRAAVTRTMTIKTARLTPWERILLPLELEGLKVKSRVTYDHVADRVFEIRVSGPTHQFEYARERLLSQSDVLDVLVH